MYTATKKETIKTMKRIDMTTPRTMDRIISTLRDTQEAMVKSGLAKDKLWFTEEKVTEVLDKFHADTIQVGASHEPYYYIEDWICSIA